MQSAQPAGELDPHGFVGLVAHSIRWRLLGELARSDRSVNELTDLVGERQALVSYHLGRLRDGGLVRTKRSAHDGRATYYSIDLARCAEALAAAGAALHPGLSLQLVAPAPPPPGGRPARVLFACTGNGARSQIAEALLQRVAGESVEVVSAGSHPKPVHPNAVKVLAEKGIDIGERRSKSLELFEGVQFDYVITLCDKVREVCPDYGVGGEAIHWSLEDPSGAGGGDAATYSVFRDLAAELESRIGFLTALINKETTHD